MGTLENIEKYAVGEKIILDGDEYIKTPTALRVYFDKANHSAVSGASSTFIILYVVGTAVRRIGTESDEKIILSMLKRGFAVAVLDYLGAPDSLPPRLEWSVQGIRGRLISGELLPKNVFPSGNYMNTLVAPSGFDVSVNNVFWSIDRHGADGTLDKIVEIWNCDFRSVKGEVLVKWVDGEGKRKKTQTAFDGSEPLWLDRNGGICQSGEYIRIKHTLAEKITDCVKKDGGPICLDLFMHFVYPTAPEEKVPVMCLSGSSEQLCKGSATADRPQSVGALFRGYAGVMYDYCYTPMARDDHYGYFDGFPAVGHITGDNVTYSVHHYSDKLVHTAAMRYVRYVAATDTALSCMDTERIGVFGNSKGGWMTYLGEEHPETIPPMRMFVGHHGESRYDNGDTETKGIIRGGEPQPWLTANGKNLASNAHFIYASCGGACENITAGHVPTFISCNRRDNWNSYLGTSNQFVNICRSNDIRAMWFDIDLAHTLARGLDYYHGVDTYDAFFDFAGYWLKDDPIKVKYAFYEDGAVTVKFTGSVENAEICALTAVSEDGERAEGHFESAYGKTEWKFVLGDAREGKKYVLTVPSTLKGDNGKELGQDHTLYFVCDREIKPGKAKTWKKVTREIPLSDFRGTALADIKQGKAPNGSDALVFGEPKTVTSFVCEEFYGNPMTVLTCATVIKNGKIEEKDLGRRFKITMRVFDTEQRYIQVSLSPCNVKDPLTPDYNYTVINALTKAGEWTDVTLDYTVYDPKMGEQALGEKVLSIKAFHRGNASTPIYFSDFKVTEFIPENS